MDPHEFFSQAKAAAAAQAEAEAQPSPGRGLLERARPGQSTPARAGRSRAAPEPAPEPRAKSSRRPEPKPKPKPRAEVESAAEEPERKSRLPLVLGLIVVVAALIFGSRYLPQLSGPLGAPPDLSGVVFTLADLPEGFRPLSAAELKVFGFEPGRPADIQGDYKEASVQQLVGFVSTDPLRTERVFSFVLYPLTFSERSDFDRMAKSGTSADIRQAGEVYSDSSLVPELSRLGEASYGYTARSDQSGLRCYRVLIRRGSALLFISYVFEDGKEPIMDIEDLAKLMDGRLADALAKPASAATVAPTATVARIRLPDLSSVVLTTTDLPETLLPLSEDDRVRFYLTEPDMNQEVLKYQQARVHQLASFSNMNDEGWTQLLIVYLVYPLVPEEQSNFDNALATDPLKYGGIFAVPAENVTITLVPGMEDLGEKAFAIKGSKSDPPVNTIELQFRRGPVLVSVVSKYLAEEGPAVDVHALGKLLDDRLVTAMATYTPAPTPPPSPTPTPTITPTPAPSPTPLADFSKAGLTLQDLPNGFSANPEDCASDFSMDHESFAQVHQSASFVFQDPYAYELICTYLVYPLTEEEQAEFDQEISMENTAKVLASGTLILDDAYPPTIMSGMSDMGNKSIGIAIEGNLQGELVRMELVMLRRGPVVENYIVAYRQGGAPSVNMRQLIGIVDTRVYEALKAGPPVPE